ncbi:MAG: hypothetical protein ACNYPI_03410 [Arenicellales bacterium WSBS_2016_MAG_OTU3]
MSEKQELIKQMLAMQQKFTAYEQEHGINSEEYYTAQPGHPLSGYSGEYSKLANRVAELAHKEQESKA